MINTGFLTIMNIKKGTGIEKLPNGTFEHVYEIQKIFCPNDFFWNIIKMTFTRNIANMSQDSPNPGFMSVELESWDFLKKDWYDFKNSFQFGFLSISKIRWCFLIFIIF